MISSVIAQQIQRGVADFLRTTFPITSAFFRDTLNQLLETPEKMFRGPYLPVKLPFRPAAAGPPGFTSYRHRQMAFDRLDSQPVRSTIVATARESGKTSSPQVKNQKASVRVRGGQRDNVRSPVLNRIGEPTGSLALAAR